MKTSIRHSARAIRGGSAARLAGFSLIEVLFAIGMLGIGVVGVLSLFATGISAAAWSKNTTMGSMEAQSLYTRIVAEVDAGTNKRTYLMRIKNPLNTAMRQPDNEWIHSAGNDPTPVRVSLESDLFWKCRVSHMPMDLEEPLNAARDVTDPARALPQGLYSVAIAIYRSTSENVPQGKEPIIVYTTYVTAGY